MKDCKKKELVDWTLVPARENALFVPAWMKGEKVDGKWEGKVLYIN